MTKTLSDTTKEIVFQPLLENGWAIDDDAKGLYKTFQFNDFTAAFSWMTHVALWAEKWDHHPNWRNVYSRVEVTLTTHDANGLTPLDAKLARKMDDLFILPLVD